MRRPLLFLAGFLAAGCWAGADLPPRAAASLLGLSVAVLVPGLASERRCWAHAALAAGSFGIGAAAAGVETAQHEASGLLPWVEGTCPGGPVRLEGLAARDAEEDAERQSLLLDVGSVSCAGRATAVAARVRVDVWGRWPRVEILDGDRLALWATLRAPREAGSAGALDRHRARRAGIHAYGSCKSPRLVSLLRRGAAGEPRAGLARLRLWARRELGRLLPPSVEEGLVRAMVLGDRGGLDAETEEAFRASGTYHVLAISGAQVALLAGLLLWPLRRLATPRWLVALLLSALLPLYALLVGSEVPVVRATIMALVLLIGWALDLKADLANLAGLAAAIVLVQRPSAVADLAFQLSFGATLGILLLTRPLLQGLRRLPLRLDVALAASLAAQLALAPLLAFHLSRLAPAAIILNLAAVPLSGAILVAGLVTLLVAAAGSALASAAAAVAWSAAHALLRVGSVVQAWPVLELRVGPPAAWAWALHVVGLWAFVDARRRRRGAALLALALLGMAFGRTATADGRLHLTALDVGQGDALVLRSPAGRVVLVDLGDRLGRRDACASIVLPYLWRLGVRRVDRLVLSHAHPDHVGGLRSLLRTFPVDEVWEGPAPANDPTYSEVDRALRAARVARRTVIAGVRELWDGVELEVVGPAAPRRRGWRTRNDDSLVLLVRYGRVRVLLPGDIEAAGEARLRIEGVQIVKVPHHGSRTSSGADFVRALAPRLALVSAGFRNPFGHPDREVVARYRAAGALVARTDRDGSLEAATDGRRVWLASPRAGSAILR